MIKPAVIFLSLFAAASLARSDRPNIIFLMTDDQRWDNMGCYGRPEFKTPNIDALAEQGVAYATVAICMPSRVTMMTGQARRLRYVCNYAVQSVR